MNQFWSLEVSGLRATQDSLSEEKENSPQATQKKKKKGYWLPSPSPVSLCLCFATRITGAIQGTSVPQLWPSEVALIHDFSVCWISTVLEKIL